jgi:hypothetical protein
MAKYNVDYEQAFRTILNKLSKKFSLIENKKLEHLFNALFAQQALDKSLFTNHQNYIINYLFDIIASQSIKDIFALDLFVFKKEQVVATTIRTMGVESVNTISNVGIRDTLDKATKQVRSSAKSASKNQEVIQKSLMPTLRPAAAPGTSAYGKRKRKLPGYKIKIKHKDTRNVPSLFEGGKTVKRRKSIGQVKFKKSGSAKLV